MFELERNYFMLVLLIGGLLFAALGLLWLFKPEAMGELNFLRFARGGESAGFDRLSSRVIGILCLSVGLVLVLLWARG